MLKRKLFWTWFLGLLLGAYLVLRILAWLILPKPLFKNDYSSVLYAQEGILLSAFIAQDEQWRFPELDSVPDKVIASVLAFEDQYFYQHPGFNPWALWKAFKTNLSSDKRRGGSTITMQLARMILGNQERSYLQKSKEFFYTLLLEVSLSKNEILNSYLSHVPMGGNVVGLSAATWRYYQRSPHDLSWAEAALLAVLPNAPGLLYPGVGADLLEQKRNQVLKKLFVKKGISEEEYTLALLEPLPIAPPPLQQLGVHYLAYLMQQFGSGKIYHSTLIYQIQQNVQQKCNRYSSIYATTLVHDLSAVVLDVETMEVLAYVGNTYNGTDKGSPYVDVAQALRSSGSALKPFLYAMALTEGKKIPSSLVFDYPYSFGGYRPQNYTKKFYGIVPLKDALCLSLNLPAVQLLAGFGIEKFKDALQIFGFDYIKQSGQHYGLSLILGGAEVNLFDLTTAYALLANSVNHQLPFKGHVGLTQEHKSPKSYQLPESISLYNAYQFLDILSNVNRPREEDGWQYFNDSKKIAWKTGTSFGHRDAWAVGLSGKYAVGVWVGNASGEGRPGLTGTHYAGPVMFSIFKSLQDKSWFAPPSADLQTFKICTQSGYLANADSPEISEELHEASVHNLSQQQFFKRFWMDEGEQFRVYKNCYAGKSVLSPPYLVLPPLVAYYHQQHSATYQYPPPFHKDCYENDVRIAISYPQQNTKLKLPINIEGEQEPLILEGNSLSDEVLYWHLNEVFLGTTQGKHHIAAYPKKGKNVVTLLNEKGNTVVVQFEVY